MRDGIAALDFGHGTLPLPPLGESVLLEPRASGRLEPPQPLQRHDLVAKLEGAGLIDVAARARRIAVVINDQTRKGGMGATLAAVVDVLRRARRSGTHRGASGADRTIHGDLIVAYGLHPRQSDDVSGQIYGHDALGSLRVAHHDASAGDDGSLRLIGELPGGAPLSIASLVADADLRVVVGAVGFHYYAGFSGGRKAILPGVADAASIVRNHLRVIDPTGPGGRAVGCAPARLDGNPVSEEMLAGARLLDARGGCTFLANAILAAGGPGHGSSMTSIRELVCGLDHEAEFRRGCARLVETNAIQLDALPPFDGVIASAGGWPYDATLYQAHKAYDNAFRALARSRSLGGMDGMDGMDGMGEPPPVVFVARCAEGLGHPRFGAWLEHPTRDAHYAALLARYEIVGQTSLALRDKAAATRTIAVTDLDAALCAKIGWEHASSLDEAIARAERAGPDSRTGHRLRWAIMPSAAAVLPMGAPGTARSAEREG